ncbi:MAG: hypothetical protein H6577_00210 [Lewinellaceae bacterium]|nr:hypothetical protein [Saprospiraceae bacterium]MCB9336532.1 hypothetical protein [Lewinellaceae bacterium]
MKMRIVFLLLAAAFSFVTCKQYQEAQLETRTRQLKPSDITAYHPPIQLTIAWVPYEDLRLIKTKKDEWKIVKDDKPGKKGNLPMILATYPNSNDTIWIDMNTDNELLGKLIKHSLMTQEPIKRPFGEFFDMAACQKCHPPEVKAKLD